MRCCPANGYSDDIKRHLQAAPKLFGNPATSLSATLSHLESGRHTPPVQRRSSPAKAHPLAVTSFAKTAFIASDSKPNHLVLFANLPITRAAARQVINPTLAVADHLFTGYLRLRSFGSPLPSGDPHSGGRALLHLNEGHQVLGITLYQLTLNRPTRPCCCSASRASSRLVIAVCSAPALT